MDGWRWCVVVRGGVGRRREHAEKQRVYRFTPSGRPSAGCDRRVEGTRR
jgi:hypothetical protein